MVLCCEACNQDFPKGNQFCSFCGDRLLPKEQDKSASRSFLLISTSGIGIYYLLIAVLFYYFSDLSMIKSQLIILPLLVFPILAGGSLLSCWGVYQYNPGAKYFGLFFLMLQIVEIILSFLYNPAIVWLSQSANQVDTHLHLLLVVHKLILTQPLLIFLRLVVICIQTKYLLAYTGHPLDFQWHQPIQIPLRD